MYPPIVGSGDDLCASEARQSGLREDGLPGQSQRGHHRQPIGEDHGKRGPRGYDAGKKVKGRKRHIVVDTLGLPLAVAVHPADIQDRDGARLVLARLLGRFPRLQPDLG